MLNSNHSAFNRNKREMKTIHLYNIVLIISLLVLFVESFVPSMPLSHYPSLHSKWLKIKVHPRRMSLSAKKLSRFQQQLEEMRQQMGLPDNLLDAAKDSESFSSMQEENKKRQQDEVEKKEKRKETKFVPIEEWDAMEKEKEKNKGPSWEDRVRFDGMRYGNKNRQHDIIVRNLNK